MRSVIERSIADRQNVGIFDMDLELIARVHFDKRLYRFSSRLLIISWNKLFLILYSFCVTNKKSSRVIYNRHDNVEGHGVVDYLTDILEPS